MWEWKKGRLLCPPVSASKTRGEGEGEGEGEGTDVVGVCFDGISSTALLTVGARHMVAWDANRSHAHAHTHTCMLADAGRPTAQPCNRPTVQPCNRPTVQPSNRPPPYRRVPTVVWQALGSDDHRARALDAARQAMVLLKNQAGVLPLSAAKGPSVALLGPHAKTRIDLAGNYFEVCGCVWVTISR